ncbi:MAG: hypothetical protein R3F49_25280 [Planctomycetota bacterium]
MKLHSHYLTTALALTAVAQAQVVYDAGTPGNPLVAPSPTAQGWTESIAGTGSAGPLSPDPNAPMNSWQFADSGPGRVQYTHAHPWLGTQSYEFELVMRPLGGQIYLEVVAGSLIDDNSFYLQLDVVGADLQLRRFGAPPIVFPNATDGYHSFRFVSGFSWDDAFVFYDGTFMGLKPYDSFANFNGPQMVFGTRDGIPGRARVHFARFGVLYDHEWGAPYCGPAVVNSSGRSGTTRMFGSILFQQNNMELRAEDLPPHTVGYFLVSPTQGASPVGQGRLCLGGAIGRYNQPGAVQSSGPTGAIHYAIDTSGIPSPTGFVPMAAGQTWNFQCWFRDANPMTTSNLTDAVSVSLPN